MMVAGKKNKFAIIIHRQYGHSEMYLISIENLFQWHNDHPKIWLRNTSYNNQELKCHKTVKKTSYNICNQLNAISI